MKKEINKQKAINIAKQTLKSLGADIDPYEIRHCIKIDKEEWGVAVVGAGSTVKQGAVVSPKMMVEAGVVFEKAEKEDDK